jgi:hypothetical protein
MKTEARHGSGGNPAYETETCGAKFWTAGTDSHVWSCQFVSKASSMRDFPSDPLGVGDFHVAVGLGDDD